MIVKLPKVKICGITRPCDIAMANRERPDYIGFVFAASRRRVSPCQAKELRKELDKKILPVGVFVDAEISQILSLVTDGTIDIIQLHGTEDEAYIARLKKETKTPIIKAISVTKKGDVQKWETTTADYLLLDHKGGGTGHTFDWQLIGNTRKPYFLAGGLQVSNIAAAIASTNPFAVDVSSGVETDGVKDPVKVGEFISIVRGAVKSPPTPKG